MEGFSPLKPLLNTALVLKECSKKRTYLLYKYPHQNHLKFALDIYCAIILQSKFVEAVHLADVFAYNDSSFHRNPSNTPPQEKVQHIADLVYYALFLTKKNLESTIDRSASITFFVFYASDQFLDPTYLSLSSLTHYSRFVFVV